ncbi:double zinc ribbon domain-containing protein, partial [Tritonibacter sp. SIMBA_163]|uniref:double zinc ribbon domain-containing protein n=1 Tax=Tritonibacter sp. SIMBA_163 TaxID=3080868 RepID=UPI00397FFA10
MAVDDTRTATKSVLRFPALLRWIGDLVYRPVCPACGVLTGRHASFCSHCWREIR